MIGGKIILCFDGTGNKFSGNCALPRAWIVGSESCDRDRFRQQHIENLSNAGQEQWVR